MTSTASPMMSNNVSMRQEPPPHHAPIPNTSSTTSHSHSAPMLARNASTIQPGHSVLVEGKLLQGEKLLEYARQKGLCPKCVQHVTHKRVRKRLGMLRYSFEWLPLTVTDEQAGNYTVYKGYCLQPTCYTLEEAQIKLGERASLVRSGSIGRGVAGSKSRKTRSRGMSSNGHSRRDLMNHRDGSRRDLRDHSAHSRRSERSGESGSSSDVDETSNREAEDGTENDRYDVSNSSSIPMTPIIQQSQQEQQQELLLTRQGSRGRRITQQHSSTRRTLTHQHSSPRRTLTQQHSAPRLGSSTDPSSSSSTSYGISSNPGNSVTGVGGAGGGSDHSSHHHHSEHRRATLHDIPSASARNNATAASRMAAAAAQSPRSSNRAVASSGAAAVAVASDRPKVRRVPDRDILQQLCRLHLNRPSKTKAPRGGLSIASESDLWSILHKRYGREHTVPSSLTGRISVLLNILQDDQDATCFDPAWTLMSCLTKQQQDMVVPNNIEDNQGRLAEEILTQVSNEFDRDDLVDGSKSSDAKRYAAQTLFHLLKNEEDSVDSPVLGGLQTMSPSRRHHWITVLLDMLMFQGDEDEHIMYNSSNYEDQQDNISTKSCHEQDSSAGTAENLFVVWNLLLSQPLDSDEDGTTSESLLLMKTIVGIAVSILSSAEGDGVYSISEKGVSQALSIMQAESALGLLATVASRAGATALAGRQYECLRVIGDTCVRFDDQPDVLLQGAHAICHILASFEWFLVGAVAGVSKDLGGGGGGFGESSISDLQQQQSPPNLYAAECVVDVMMMILSCQERRSAQNLPCPEELNRAACRLLTSLLESDDAMQTFVVETALPRGPELIHALVRMLETTEVIPIGESASGILVYLLKKDFATTDHLREIPDIAAIVVHTMDRYRDAPFIQENLCLIIAHLVSLTDHQLGQEFGEAGGLNVLAELLLHPGQDPPLVESALRALIGTLSSVDTSLLLKYQTSMSEVVVSVMENTNQVLEVQLAGLDALQCLCVRADGPSKNHLVRALPVVVKVMEDYLANAGVLTRCCTILRMVARTVEDHGLFVQTGAVKMLINAMLIHPDATEFVLEGMATLKDLAAEPSFRENFNSADAEACLMSLLEVNATAPDVVALGFATLNNVLVDFQNRTVAPLQTVVLQLIIAALKDFPDHEMVWTNAFLLLKSYTYNEDNLVLMMQDNYSDELIPLLVDSERLLVSDSLERAKYIIRKLQ